MNRFRTKSLAFLNRHEPLAGNKGDARRVWAAALARDPDSKPLKATIKRFLPDAQ